MSPQRQQTIARSGELAGVGLHTGVDVRVRLLPAPVNTGIVFRRTDLEGAPDVPALVANVVDTDRGTTLGVGAAKVFTVEHLLAAVGAHQIDNLIIELDAQEPPAADGSALPFVALIESCGVVEQDAPPGTCLPTRPSRSPRGTQATW